jgi:hypothetical protein
MYVINIGVVMCYEQYLQVNTNGDFPDMIGTKLVTEFLQVVLMTGRVKGESPVSVFIIAQPEHGKTSVCLESPFSCAVDVTDSTGRGLLEIIKYKPEITHIIFNDLTIISAHGRTVRSYLISIINAMTEEGIRSIAFPGMVEGVPQNGKRGIIACCTPSLVKDTRTWFNKIGMTTRILPFYYTYSEALVIKVMTSIRNNTQEKLPGKLNIPSGLIPVEINSNTFAKEIEEIARAKSKELDDQTGFRRHKQFRKLAQAHALMSGEWKNASVGAEQIDFLKRIYPYISYKQGCIL